MIGGEPKKTEFGVGAFRGRNQYKTPHALDFNSSYGSLHKATPKLVSTMARGQPLGSTYLPISTNTLCVLFHLRIS